MEDKQPESFLDSFARRIVLPAALPFDTLSLINSIVVIFLQLTAPPWYKALRFSFDGNIYYMMSSVSIVSYALLLLAALYLVFPLLARTRKRIAYADRITNDKNRKRLTERLVKIKKQQEQLAWLTVVMFGLMFVPQLTQRITTLAGWDGGIVDFVISVVSLPVPILGYIIISSAENDGKDKDEVETAFEKATGILFDMFGRIVVNEDGLLTRKGHALLDSGTGGDVPGMLDAVSEDAPVERWYFIHEICEWLRVPSDVESADYRKVSRIITDSRNDPKIKPFIRKQKYKGRKRWQVAQDVLSLMYADYKPAVSETT